MIRKKNQLATQLAGVLLVVGGVIIVGFVVLALVS